MSKRLTFSNSSLFKFIKSIAFEIKKNKKQIEELNNKINKLEQHALLDSSWNEEEGG